MKILQIINNLGSGGAEKLISDFVPLMKEKGHKVEVLLLQKKGSIYIDDLESKGVRVTCISEYRLYSINHILNLRSFINNNQFDLINVHLFPTLYYLGLLSLLGTIKPKIIYTRHYTKSKRTHNIIYSALDRFIYKGYDKVIAISDSVKEEIINEGKASEDNIEVISNGVDIDKFTNSTPIEMNKLYSTYKSNHKIITMVGRFSQTKDQETLIRAIDKLPKNINLILVGEGALMDTHKELVKNLDIVNRVHFLGLRKDVDKILRASDIGVLSSKMEGMPVSALEIFASEIPFIGSNVSGIKDIFSGFDSGTSLFKYQDTNALAKLISDLLKDDSMRYKNIKISQKIASNFSLEKMVESYLNLYASCIEIKQAT